MSTRFEQAGYHRISRHDGIFQEREHDAYKARGKPPEPAACPQCGAIFHKGRWQWGKAPENAHQDTCPACLRIHDHFPAGYVTLSGAFVDAHRDDIMHLVHNQEMREKAQHPLKRIMAITEQDGETQITTTDIHLARGIGEALHHAYQGNLDYHYSPAQNLLRVSWSR